MQAKTAFSQYQPGMSWQDAFPPDSIPLMKMEDLRQLNFLISRGISYEQTVDSFLLLFMVHEQFRPLRKREQIVILLNEEGALVREDGRWTLYFSPGRSERDTLREGTDLYEVYASVLEREKNGEICKIQVPERSLKAMVSGKFPFCILDEYCKRRSGGYLGVAARIVTEGPEKLFRRVPTCHYGALATVDVSEIEKYHAIRRLMHEYIRRYDDCKPGERPKPLSIAVFGAPGSGKSFGVRQIAQSLGRFSVFSLNLSQYHGPGELFAALKEALTVPEGEIPLVFFDEFDAELDGVSRGWLKYFLAPMQDGEFSIAGKLYEIPGSVFVFAGATASSFREFLPHTPEAERSFAQVKGPDFVSRLKGILDIKGPNPSCPTDRKYLVRRALLLRNMLLQQAPGIYDPETGVVEISRSLLNTLLRVSEYRHGSRSIEFILGMSRLAGIKRFTPSCLPLAEQLDIHLDVQDFMDKLNFEQVLGHLVNRYARLAHEHYRKKHMLECFGPMPTREQQELLHQEEEMADWDTLDEYYKKGYRNRLRYLGQKLLAYDQVFGIRPVIPQATDTIQELYGPVLEYLARLDHERWMHDRAEEGWSYGKDAPDMKRSSDMLPYEELPEATRDKIRLDLRTLPAVLRDMGFELYKKSDLE